MAAKISPDDSAMAPKLKKTIEGMGIQIKKFIGQGTYSRVYLATGEKQRDVALKLIDISKKTEYVKSFLPREIEIVKQLQHENIVRVYQVYHLVKHAIIVLETEFCVKGDLLEKITQADRLSEAESKLIYRQLIEALKYLESRDILHRDLKCENIFLDQQENVKLGDFGFSRILHKGEISKTFCGSKAYVAPEILRGKSYEGNGVDIWSAGIVLYIMITGRMPYDVGNVQKMIERQLSHKIRFPRSLTLSFESKMLIFGILHPVPSNRWSYDEMIKSDWLKDTPYKIKTIIPENISEIQGETHLSSQNSDSNNDKLATTKAGKD